ncbi:MAG: hypothetical protein IJJ74_10550 [Eubacterium sp.]|nr:hypothetical protein [Eubacterium sp.]
MKKEDLLCDTVDPAKLDYENPIFEGLEEDPNNPWFLEEQIQFYKRNGVPIAYFAFKGQKSRHYYAIFEGKSEGQAKGYNRMRNAEVKKKERADAAIKEHETESYDVMVENGYDAPKEGDNPEEIVCYKVVMDALAKEYKELTDEKKRICDAIKDSKTQRVAAEELGMPRRTYRDKKDETLDGLAKKMKDYR